MNYKTNKNNVFPNFFRIIKLIELLNPFKIIFSFLIFVAYSNFDQIENFLVVYNFCCAQETKK